MDAGARMTMARGVPTKAVDNDFIGRWREVISDPLNLLIERVPEAGMVVGQEVYLHNGNRVPIGGDQAYYGQYSQLLALNRGVHEPLEEYVFQELVRRLPASPSMIELGAYWAHYSMWLKRLRPTSSVTMIEPDSGNMAAGQGNFFRNGFAGEFLQATVGKENWVLDDFFAQRQLSHLNVLHADIQGAEGELLDGAQKALKASQIDYVFVSTHSQALHQEVKDRLADLGYCVEVSSDVEYETTSGDGFIFASSRKASRIFTDFKHFGRTAILTSSADEALQAVTAMRNSADPKLFGRKNKTHASSSTVDIVYRLGDI